MEKELHINPLASPVPLPWTNTRYRVVCSEHACDTAYVRTVCDVLETHMKREKIKKEEKKNTNRECKGLLKM